MGSLSRQLRHRLDEMRVPVQGSKSMNSSHCCQWKLHTTRDARQQRTWLRRVRKVAGWIVPGTLLALMLFNAARLGARTDDAGNLLRLHEQDRTAWNQAIIHRGIVCLRH